MQKISIVVDTNKLDKKRIVERKFNNKDGVEVVVKELKLDVIPLKEKKVITSGDGWKLVKVGFVAESQTKEERQSKAKSSIVGDAMQFEESTKQPSFDKDSKGKDILAEDIPF